MKDKIQDTESSPLECCLYVCGKGTIQLDNTTFHKTMIGGVILSSKSIVTPCFKDKHQQEMWKGRILIYPMEKYSNFKEKGLRMDQMLLHNYELPESWEERIL